MKTCIYCGDRVKLLSGEIYRCKHCEVNLGPNSPYGEVGEDGSRPGLEGFKSGVILRDEVYLSGLKVNDLMKMNLSMIYSILKELRLLRSDAYALLAKANEILKQESELSASDFSKMKDATAVQGDNYEFWSRKMWMVENVCIKRFGYYPAAIHEKTLDQMEQNTLKNVKKNMVIKKTNVLSRETSIS